MFADRTLDKARRIGKMRLSRETVARLTAADPDDDPDCGCSASFSCPPQCKKLTGG
jgi:hypothetical protein